MNDHGIVSGILVFVGVLLFVARVIKRLGGTAAKPLAATTPSPPRHPELVEGQPRTSFVVDPDQLPHCGLRLSLDSARDDKAARERL
jgi:hypothetical protein